jgi:hypothetical protein
MDLKIDDDRLVDPYQIPPHFRVRRGRLSVYQYAVFFRPDRMMLIKIGGFPWQDTSIQAVVCFLTCLLGGAISFLGTAFFFPIVVSGTLGLAGLITGAAAPFIVPRVYSRWWYKQNSRGYHHSFGSSFGSYRPPVDKQEKFLYSIRALSDDDLLQLDKKNHQFLYEDVAYVEFQEVHFVLLSLREMRVNLFGRGFDRELKYRLLETQNYRACLAIASPHLQSKMKVLTYVVHYSAPYFTEYGKDVSADP